MAPQWIFISGGVIYDPLGVEGWNHHKVRRCSVWVEAYVFCLFYLMSTSNNSLWICHVVRAMGVRRGGKGGGHVPPGSSEQWFFRAKTQNFPGHPHQHLYGDLRITLPPWIFFLRTPMVRAEGLEKTGNLQSWLCCQFFYVVQGLIVGRRKFFKMFFFTT